MSVREMLALIPVFDAILSEGSISRAAKRLGVTQSAVSQALARLRKLANDDLFESTGVACGQRRGPSRWRVMSKPRSPK